MQPGDEAARQDRQAYERSTGPDECRQYRQTLLRHGMGGPERKPGPNDRSVQNQRQPEMHHQPVSRNTRAIRREPGCHHEPPDRTLQSAEQKQQGQPPAQPVGHTASPPETDQRQQKHQTDRAAPQPVSPFEPEDALKTRQAEPLVDQIVLRDFLVQGEQALPLGIAHRRQRAHQRRPLHDRQAGAGQAGHATQHDHDQDHPSDDEQPKGDGTVLGIGQHGVNIVRHPDAEHAIFPGLRPLTPKPAKPRSLALPRGEC